MKRSDLLLLILLMLKMLITYMYKKKVLNSCQTNLFCC